MKQVAKFLAAAGALILLLLPVEQAQGWWWGNPWHGGWRHGYVFDPAYRWGTPATRQYIRDLNLFGPVYADWKRMRTWWW